MKATTIIDRDAILRRELPDWIGVSLVIGVFVYTAIIWCWASYVGERDRVLFEAAKVCPTMAPMNHYPKGKK